jgi:hypothetical protein
VEGAAVQVPVFAEVVIPATGQRFPLNGRAAAAVALLAAHADRVNGFEVGSLEFHATPSKLHMVVKQSLPPAHLADARMTADPAAMGPGELAEARRLARSG